MITLSVESWTTIGTVLSAMVGLYLALRSELRAVEGRLDQRMDRLDVRMDRLDDRIHSVDDRVYALATGLRPRIEAESEGV